jgi:hypothetical protein
MEVTLPFLRHLRFKLSLLSTLAALAAAQANAANLVQNGDFEINGGPGQLGGGISYATGWTSAGPAIDGTAVPFNFILDSTADDGGYGFVGGFPSVYSAADNTNIHVWGPGNGVNNGFTGSPTGGYFLGGDADYANGAVTQTINGLQVGHKYELSFYWAASQFYGTNGDSYSGWNVTFGSESTSTGTANNASAGFVPWAQKKAEFTASSASQVLSFLATGGPSGVPPFALLDGVSLTDVTAPVPEPATLGMLLAGGGLLGLATRRRRRHRQDTGA